MASGESEPLRVFQPHQCCNWLIAVQISKTGYIEDDVVTSQGQYWLPRPVNHIYVPSTRSVALFLFRLTSNQVKHIRWFSLGSHVLLGNILQRKLCVEVVIKSPFSGGFLSFFFTSLYVANLFYVLSVYILKLCRFSGIYLSLIFHRRRIVFTENLSKFR